jgi:hypothetical protein
MLLDWSRRPHTLQIIRIYKRGYCFNEIVTTFYNPLLSFDYT